jgi:hypothetical protein
LSGSFAEKSLLKFDLLGARAEALIYRKVSSDNTIAAGIKHQSCLDCIHDVSELWNKKMRDPDCFRKQINAPKKVALGQVFPSSRSVKVQRETGDAKRSSRNFFSGCLEYEPISRSSESKHKTQLRFFQGRFAHFSPLPPLPFGSANGIFDIEFNSSFSALFDCSHGIIRRVETSAQTPFCGIKFAYFLRVISPRLILIPLVPIL